jgi:hypothetical protein
MDQLQAQHVEPKPTYYVIRMDGEGKAPKKAHHTRRGAYKAAESLARNNPGVSFEVVKKKTSLVFRTDLPISVS